MNRALLVTALLGAASLCYAHKIRVDFDHGIHFGGYRTYSWAQSGGGPDEELFPNGIMRHRITGFIEEALAARGLKHVASGGDLLIDYRVKVEAEPVFTTFSDGWGPGWGWGNGWAAGWGGGISTTTVTPFYDDTLIVDMVDAGKGKLVFQGTSTQELSSKADINTRKLNKAVCEIFKFYPPR
jgi:hypothetical protein